MAGGSKKCQHLKRGSTKLLPITRGIKHFARYASIYQHNTLLFHLIFQRILYRHSKFCGALCIFFCFLSQKRHFAAAIVYYFTLFSAHSLPSFQILRHASRAFTNTIFYWFTLFSAHSLPSFQILQRALRKLSKKIKTLKRGDQQIFEVRSANFSNRPPKYL